MITRTEDLRPGLYRVRRLHTNHDWDEMTIPPMPPDEHGYMFFSLKSHRDGRVIYGLLQRNSLRIYTIHYPQLSPIPIEMQPIATPQASISHVRRVEL